MMDVFIGYDSGYGSKPEADGFLAACTALGVTPAETVMIGDTSADIGAAKAAGAGLFIGVSALYPERTKPLQDIEYIVADTTGIAPILARLAKAS
jgi:phosphoglycolate phosphatase